MPAKKKSLEVLNATLLESGFKRRTEGIYTVELGPDTLAWLGLNQSTRHRAVGEVEVIPIVGVRLQAVERLVADLAGKKFHMYVPPTLSEGLGYLMPSRSYRSWIFSANDDPASRAAAANEIAKAALEYGLPFARAFSDLRPLSERFAALRVPDQQSTLRYLASLMLLGETTTLRLRLDEAIAALGARTDAAANDLRQFARAAAAEPSERGVAELRISRRSTVRAKGP